MVTNQQAGLLGLGVLLTVAAVVIWGSGGATRFSL